MARTPRATIDFETRSRVDLKKSGAWKYAQSDTTEIICLCYKVPGMKNVGAWVPNWVADILGVPHMPPPKVLLDWIASGGVVEAHNAMFERAIWRCKLLEEFWPDIPDHQWRCSAAKAASYSLPRALEKCCEVMRLDVRKDKEGHALMMRMCKPRKATKKKAEYYVQDPESIKRLVVYCKQDVRAEERFSESLPDLSPVEQEIWIIDQEINERGIKVDLELVDKAIDTLAYLKSKYEEEIKRITNGRVEKVTQRNQLKEWMADAGFEIPNTQAATLDELLENDFLPDHIHDVVSRFRMAGRASTAKYKTIRYRASEDGFCRDILMYAGASRTSRWCLIGDHEVLTPGGWKRLDQWDGGLIVTWDNGEFEFNHSNQVSFDYDGPLKVFDTARFSQISTPDHGMPARWRDDKGYSKVLVDDLKRGHMIVREGLRQPKNTFWSSDLVRLLIMTQADGHYTDDGALRWHFKKERKVQRCKYLLAINRIHYNTSRNGDGTTSITIPKTRLPKPLQQSKDKTFPWNMLDCDPEVFFDELFQWDGGQIAPDSWQYSTTNKSNADFVQALAHLSGRSCNITEQQKPVGKEHWNTNYYCNIWGKCPDFEFRPQHIVEDFMIGGKVYCAETSTGYFLVRRNNKVWITGNSGVGIQPQNLPRGKIKNMDDTVFTLMNLDAEELEEEYEDLYSVFSGALRGAIIPGEGRKLVTADYSSVEARGLFWVCGHQEGVDMFLRGVDSYLEMAAFVNNLDYTTIKREFDEDKANKAPVIRWADERQFGKQIILGAGYQLGPPKFIDYCAQSKIIIDLDTAKRGILGYRERHKPVKEFWYACENAAIAAMQNPGQVIRVNEHIAYKYANRFLFCQLPSGRLIPYPYPKLEWITREWVDVDEETGKIKTTKSTKLQLSYEEQNSFNKKWSRSYTYGGKLVENIVQALCRDLMAHAMRVVKKQGWFQLLLTVHDELVTDLPNWRISEMGGDKAAYELLCQLMCAKAKWAEGFPIAAEGATMLRYRK